ncbi:hypothetical protein [Thermus brockianus]|uniref:Uncharacterized protein n=1 Tax=Thermus brockianus TaxID=56956 RepID=A0A1J0LU57_THEBO|nr:hypothetical protein [Thermus brockianus]APD09760.1 hypothetical protein A0O31_01652 [Thermus brockianus]
MIRVSYTPQLALPGHSLRYSWSGRVLTATLATPGQELTEQYDLSVLQPGDSVEVVEPEVLPFSPVVSARCLEDGTLEVRLLLWYEGEEPEVREEVLDG